MGNNNGIWLASWSGGKDSCMALMRALDSGMDITTLLHFDRRHGAHGIDTAYIYRQAEAAGMRLINKVVSVNDDFEVVFKETVSSVPDVRGIVFGDIYLKEHRDWNERVCDGLGIEAMFPLWDEDTGALAHEFLSRGGETVVVSAKSDVLRAEWIGRIFDEMFVRHLVDRGLDPCGEQGEFHTFVTNCSLFGARVPLEGNGACERDGHWFYDVNGS